MRNKERQRDERELGDHSLVWEGVELDPDLTRHTKVSSK